MLAGAAVDGDRWRRRRGCGHRGSMQRQRGLQRRHGRADAEAATEGASTQLEHAAGEGSCTCAE